MGFVRQIPCLDIRRKPCLGVVSLSKSLANSAASRGGAVALRTPAPLSCADRSAEEERQPDVGAPRVTESTSTYVGKNKFCNLRLWDLPFLKNSGLAGLDFVCLKMPITFSKCRIFNECLSLPRIERRKMMRREFNLTRVFNYLLLRNSRVHQMCFSHQRDILPSVVLQNPCHF